jgi:hypothetical protein
VVLRYRIFLEQKQYAAATIILRLAAVRHVAFEAADSGLLSPELAAGIRRVKGVRRMGVRVEDAGCVTEGALFRSINKTGRVRGTGMTPKCCGKSSEQPQRAPELKNSRRMIFAAAA